jgi:hypothetical protein
MVKKLGQDTLAPKKRRGPAPTGVGTSINVRLQPDQLAALDEWIAAQAPKPTRPAAVRRLLAATLNQATSDDGWMASFDEADG